MVIWTVNIKRTVDIYRIVNLVVIMQVNDSVGGHASK